MRRYTIAAALVAALSIAGLASEVIAAPGEFSAAAASPASGPSAGGACMVDPTGTVRCFTSVEGLKAAEAQLPAQPASSCFLQLFSGANFSGSELDLYATGFWVNLSSYGFADRTVSFSNGPCQSYLAKGVNGGTPWYSNSGPWVAVANLGLYWNDTIQSVYIA
jgi:hypothetical protein